MHILICLKNSTKEKERKKMKTETIKSMKNSFTKHISTHACTTHKMGLHSAFKFIGNSTSSNALDFLFYSFLTSKAL